MSTLEIKVPDIGDFTDVPIIQVFVKPGDAVKPEDPLIALESDKATMDVPSPAAGTVKELKIKVGDRVSQGKVILVLDAAAAGDGHGARAPCECAVPRRRRRRGASWPGRSAPRGGSPGPRSRRSGRGRCARPSAPPGGPRRSDRSRTRRRRAGRGRARREAAPPGQAGGSAASPGCSAEAGGPDPRWAGPCRSRQRPISGPCTRRR